MKNNPVGIKWLAANWHASSHIHAETALRYGGVSLPPYDQLNLGMDVNDDLSNVQENRKCLSQYLKLPTEPFWLNQVHGNNIIRGDPQVDSQAGSEITETTADGSYSTGVNMELPDA